MTKPTIVVFSGAWFNQTRLHVEFCMQHVIRFFESFDFPLHVITYRGNTFQEITANCIEQLRDVPEGAIGVTYSTGSQIFRLVVHEKPGLFKTGILISGFGRHGMTLRGFWNGSKVLRKPILTSMRTSRVDISDDLLVYKLFFNNHYKLEGEPCVADIVSEAHPERQRICFQLAMPFMRKTTPPLPFRAVTIWPTEDLLIPSPHFPNENVDVVDIFIGGHGSVFGKHLIVPALIEAHEHLAEHGAIDLPKRVLAAI